MFFSLTMINHDYQLVSVKIADFKVDCADLKAVVDDVLLFLPDDNEDSDLGIYLEDPGKKEDGENEGDDDSANETTRMQV